MDSPRSPSSGEVKRCLPTGRPHHSSLSKGQGLTPIQKPPRPHLRQHRTIRPFSHCRRLARNRRGNHPRLLFPDLPPPRQELHLCRPHCRPRMDHLPLRFFPQAPHRRDRIPHRHRLGAHLVGLARPLLRHRRPLLPRRPPPRREPPPRLVRERPRPLRRRHPLLGPPLPRDRQRQRRAADGKLGSAHPPRDHRRLPPVRTHRGAVVHRPHGSVAPRQERAREHVGRDPICSSRRAV